MSREERETPTYAYQSMLLYVYARLYATGCLLARLAGLRPVLGRIDLRYTTRLFPVRFPMACTGCAPIAQILSKSQHAPSVGSSVVVTGSWLFAPRT